VVVSELLDVARAASGSVDSDALIVTHPLQPFAPQAFGLGDARRFSYRGDWHGDARPGTEAIPHFAGDASSSEVSPALSWSLDELRAALCHPTRTWLRHRVGLRLDHADVHLPEAEPFALDDALRTHGLTRRLFDALIAQDPAPDTATLSRRLLAEGWIAPAAAGRREVDTLRAALLDARARWRALASDAGIETRITIDLDGVLLSATVGPVHANGLMQFRAGKAHGRNRIALGLEWLLWCASGETRPVHSLLTQHGWESRQPIEAQRASAALRRLLAIAQRARHEALPLTPDSAWIYVDAIASGADDETAFARARTSWQGRIGSEGDDPWVRLALRGADPFESGNVDAAARFRALSFELFDALGAQSGRQDAHA
jgi:exodeoxyribonuclease V gamma subunit